MIRVSRQNIVIRNFKNNTERENKLKMVYNIEGGGKLQIVHDTDYRERVKNLKMMQFIAYEARYLFACCVSYYLSKS